ncbi:MAG TPA: hypothetical protein VGI97_14835 [Gemmatimonadaceae bacterium]|jgi:hypothetical protein
MQLKQGTVVVGSPETAEQIAKLATMRAGSGPELRAEFRGGVLAPGGAFTFDASIINREGYNAEMNANLDTLLAAGSDPSNPALGNVIVLNNDGFPIVMVSCIPPLEMLENLKSDGLLSDSLEALIPLAEPAIAVVAARIALPIATATDLYDGAPVAVVSPPAPRGAPEGSATVGADADVIDIGSVRGAPAVELPFAVDQTHALDSAPVGTIATKVSETAVTVDHPTKGKAEHPIGADDVLEHLPVGSTVAVVETKTGEVAGKSIMVSIPKTQFREEIGVIVTGVNAGVVALWKWIKDETLTVEAAVKKAL